MQLLDLKSLSKTSSISVFTLRKYIKQGLPHFRVGRKILVDQDEFESWFKANFRSESSDSPLSLDEIVKKALSGF